VSGDDDYVYDEVNGEWISASEFAAKAAASTDGAVTRSAICSPTAIR